jgi:RNA polymerase sigma-70 factor (ECF subfamily)
MNDLPLIARAREGDQRALTELVDRYYGLCWRYACAMLDDADDAEDAVQDTFVRMHSGLDRYQERGQFRSWLLQILVNQCRSAARARHRRQRRFIRDPVAMSLAVASTPREPEEAMHAAIAALDPKYREALLLKHGEGLGYREMVAITGVDESALKMRVKRACDTLRRVLQPGDGNG